MGTAGLPTHRLCHRVGANERRETVSIQSIITRVNDYPKRKRFHIRHAQRFSGGYLVFVFSDYTARKVVDWFKQAGAIEVDVQTPEDAVTGVTEFYIEVA